MPVRITVVLLAMVLMLSVGRGLADAAKAPEPEAPVVVYYFHRDLRCHTCLMIESMAQDIVNVTLATDVEAGQLAWRVVNYQRPENVSCAEDLAIEGPSLVVARYGAGRLQARTILDRVWELTADSRGFESYVVGAVAEYLEAASDQEQKAESQAVEE